jgi:hypothetical protein
MRREAKEEEAKSQKLRDLEETERGREEMQSSYGRRRAVATVTL